MSRTDDEIRADLRTKERPCDRVTYGRVIDRLAADVAPLLAERNDARDEVKRLRAALAEIGDIARFARVRPDPAAPKEPTP
jgi:predicted aconitase